jgi:hypothetical protein
MIDLHIYPIMQKPLFTWRGFSSTIDRRNTFIGQIAQRHPNNAKAGVQTIFGFSMISENSHFGRWYSRLWGSLVP